MKAAMLLGDNIEKLPYVGPSYAKRLNKLGIKTIKDLLYHIPHKYIDFRNISKIGSLRPGEIFTIKGEVISKTNQFTKRGKQIQIVDISDETGKIPAIWFGQPYLLSNFHEGLSLSLSGKVDWFGRRLAILTPEYEFNQTSLHTGRLIPVYPETKGLSSKWLRRRIFEASKSADSHIKEYLPRYILKKNSLIGINEAIFLIHFPESPQDYKKAKSRLAFDELLSLHRQNLKRKRQWNKNKVSKKLEVDQKKLLKFVSSLPFKLTKSQEKVINEIAHDLQNPTPMNRLLEGDVGSGKTVVAAVAAFVAFSCGFQSIFMAPTQILANQHFETLTKILSPLKARLSLITSNSNKSDIGRTDIFVGTHALIHRKVDFSDVALIVIDEQHKFGVEQRSHLVKKTGTPHILTMTATPIPQTVAQTFYGDLDLSTLDELPQGRQKVTTWIVPNEKKAKAYRWIQKQIIKEKVQAYVVCPLIEESDKETLISVKAANQEFERLKALFPKLNISLLHGKMKSEAKDKVMSEFKKGSVNILVSTPVIEVGIDNPNATIMLIEASERFGLSQLHQLRGRVGRSEKKSYCLLFTEGGTEKAQKRLAHLTHVHSGLKLAQIDLMERGPGEIYGVKQHGIPELKIASWSDFKLIKKTKDAALELESA